MLGWIKSYVLAPKPNVIGSEEVQSAQFHLAFRHGIIQGIQDIVLRHGGGFLSIVAFIYVLSSPPSTIFIHRDPL